MFLTSRINSLTASAMGTTSLYHFSINMRLWKSFIFSSLVSPLMALVKLAMSARHCDNLVIRLLSTFCKTCDRLIPQCPCTKETADRQTAFLSGDAYLKTLFGSHFTVNLFTTFVLRSLAPYRTFLIIIILHRKNTLDVIHHYFIEVRVKEHHSSLRPFGMQGESARWTTTFWDGATLAYLAL